MAMANDERGNRSTEAVAMTIRYEPSLMEEVVLRELRQLEEKGDLRPTQKYHALADPIYERIPANARGNRREVEFENIHKKFFQEFGFLEPMEKALLEFPALGAVEEVFVKKAARQGEQWADLGRDRKRVGIRIHPAQFEDTPGLLRYLKHELQHVADMLDEAFGHPSSEEGFPDTSPAELVLIKDRYHALWDIHIDGRLQRRGKETIFDRERHFERFAVSYRNVPLAQLTAAFEAFWEAERLTHTEILAMAMDPAKVLDRGEAGRTAQGKRRRPLFAGSLCPLCRFPTFGWSNDLDTLPQSIVESVKKDVPAWEPEDGACDRCVELYKVRAGV